MAANHTQAYEEHQNLEDNEENKETGRWKEASVSEPWEAILSEMSPPM